MVEVVVVVEVVGVVVVGVVGFEGNMVVFFEVCDFGVDFNDGIGGFVVEDYGVFYDEVVNGVVDLVVDIRVVDVGVVDGDENIVGGFEFGDWVFFEGDVIGFVEDERKVLFGIG